MPTHEREITAPVDLCTSEGRLNPEAVGWSRNPLHHCEMPGWGRRKKWEYWCVTTPTHLATVTVADSDYTGTIRTGQGGQVRVDGLLGFAEDVHMRW